MLNNYSIKSINSKTIYISKEMWENCEFEDKDIILNKYSRFELKLNFLLCDIYEEFKNKIFYINFLFLQIGLFLKNYFILNIILIFILFLLIIIKKDYYQTEEYNKWFRR